MLSRAQVLYRHGAASHLLLEYTRLYCRQIHQSLPVRTPTFKQCQPTMLFHCIIVRYPSYIAAYLTPRLRIFEGYNAT